MPGKGCLMFLTGRFAAIFLFFVPAVQKMDEFVFPEAREEVEKSAHADGGNGRAFTYSFQSLEEDIRQEDGAGDHGAVETDFRMRKGDAGFVGDGLHDAFAGKGEQIGAQVEQNAERYQCHAGDEVEELVGIAAACGQAGGTGRCQRNEVAEEEGAEYLQEGGHFEFAAQNDRLQSDKADEDKRGAKPHFGRCDAAEYVGQRVERRDAEIREYGERDAGGKQEEADAVDQHAFAVIQGFRIHGRWLEGGRYV